MISRPYFVYILANRKNGALYIGVTNSLIRRISQHKTGEVDGFAKKYKIDKLVYYEIIFGIKEAIVKEKQIKKWNRAWKIKLIEKNNSAWHDLYDDILNS